MIDVSSAEIVKIIVHKIGNKTREEGFELSSNITQTNVELNELFLKHYLRPLALQKESFNFFHESDITLNAVFKFSSQIFENNQVFVEQTHHLAKHLYSVSTHPNISSGELIIFLISDIRINDQQHQGLAILKIENREEFLDVVQNNNSFELTEKSGISLTKIQKGALIIDNTNQIFVIDNLSQKTKYWLDNFLKITPEKTPEACAKLGSSIIKKISSQIDNAQDALAMKTTLEKTLKEKEEITLNEIKELSSEFLEEKDIDEIIEKSTEKASFNLDENLPINTENLSKYTKKIVRNTKLKDGIELVLSNPDFTIKSIDIINSESGFQTIIDIDFKEI